MNYEGVTMYEVRFHGRGGQGAVTAANILAVAAFKEGKDVQAFPIFGVERRGAPVAAFMRMDEQNIDIKTHWELDAKAEELIRVASKIY